MILNVILFKYIAIILCVHSHRFLQLYNELASLDVVSNFHCAVSHSPTAMLRVSHAVLQFPSQSNY